MMKNLVKLVICEEEIGHGTQNTDSPISICLILCMVASSQELLVYRL